MSGEIRDENVGELVAAVRELEGHESVVAAAAVMAEEVVGKEEMMTKSKEVEVDTKKDTKKKEKQKGLLSRMWNGIFGSRKDDFERRLERLSKEEATVLTRMRKRAQRWGRMKRHLIMFSVLLEIVAVGYAIMTARTAENWKIRAFRVLPMFLLPALSSLIYSAFSSFINMCERKDQKTLEKLRAERQSKIDELKERTNYYITQQLIQRYDTDPAAKAAAATVLASKLGADTGLQLTFGNESKPHDHSGKSSDVEHVQTTGLRNRKHSQMRATSPGGTVQHSTETTPLVANEYAEYNQPVHVDHFQGQGATAFNSGWLSRVAALLVGEDPTQCYALICGNCNMHNGLASKEDFPYVTYICPHCHAVNGPRIRPDRGSGTHSPNVMSAASMDLANAGIVTGDSPHENQAEASIVEAAPQATKAVEQTEVSAAATES